MRGLLKRICIFGLVSLALISGLVSQAAAMNTAGSTAPLGTNAWKLTQPATHGEIEGYSQSVSGPPGQPLLLNISTSAPSFTAQAYRFGDYQGGQAALVWSSGQLAGAQQAGPTFAPFDTRTVVANWSTSATVATDGWQPGAYLIKLTASSGYDSYIRYIVRSTSTAGTVALVAPVATWQAYNEWGGYSLYVGPNGDRRSWAVSFNRPYSSAGGGDFEFGVKPVVLLAERMGIPVSYLANTDLNSDPGILNGATTVVSMGHDEYWTREMRTAYTQARDAGSNLAFLGANTMYWQIRLQADDAGHPGRVVVGYRTDARLDPLYDTNPGLVTGRWRDSPSPEPESSLVGMLYECHPVNTDYRVASPDWWGFQGTGVTTGTSFSNLVGTEADRVYPNSSTPRPLQILSFENYSCHGSPTSTESTYYTTSSGAGVFAAGTLRWTCAIYHRCGSAALGSATNMFVRTVTRNILRVFAQGPAGVSHPAVDNVNQFPLPS